MSKFTPYQPPAPAVPVELPPGAVECCYCKDRPMVKQAFTSILRCTCGHEIWPAFPEFRCACNLCEKVNARIERREIEKCTKQQNARKPEAQAEPQPEPETAEMDGAE